MKRISSVLITLLCASAIWGQNPGINRRALFPGMPGAPRQTKVERKDSAAKAVSPVIPATPATPAAAEPVTVAADSAVRDSSVTLLAAGMAADTVGYVMDMPDRIDVSLILPLHAETVPDTKSFSFYFGALLAIKDLGALGTPICLNVHDMSGNSIPASLDALGKADVIIGPFNSSSLSLLCMACPEGKYVVSPLDPQAVSLTDSSRIIQMPTPWRMQIKDMIRWEESERAPEDRLVVVRESNGNTGESGHALLEELEANSIQYSTISYGILQGLKMLDTFESNTSQDGTTRFMIASDNEAFVNDVVRNIDLLSYKKHQVALYCPSKVRSFSTIEIENFHEANLKLSTTYHVDYDNRDVRNFVLSYRALFNEEPDSFAFQGYDTVNYFVRACMTYGRMWEKKIHEFPFKGLQTDFKFSSDDKVGDTNEAVRRVEYRSDYRVVTKQDTGIGQGLFAY